jgi:amidase
LCGLAGLKPTRGLLSRDGIVPLALSFDTGGPMARSVYDVAVSMNVMVGVDQADPVSALSKGKFEKDYTKFLKVGSLKGARIGVARDFMGNDPETDRVTEEAIVTLKKLGATVVEVRFPEYFLSSRRAISQVISPSDFKVQIGAYLSTLKAGYPKSLAELVSRAQDPKNNYPSPIKRDALKKTDETALGQNDPVYLSAKDQGLALARAVVAALFAHDKLDAMVYPTWPVPASKIDAPYEAAGIFKSPSSIANMTGLPDLIVPAGMTKDGLPVTLSFFGQAFSEPTLLGYGYDFEQATKAYVLPKYTPKLAAEQL